MKLAGYWKLILNSLFTWKQKQDCQVALYHYMSSSPTVSLTNLSMQIEAGSFLSSVVFLKSFFVLFTSRPDGFLNSLMSIILTHQCLLSCSLVNALTRLLLITCQIPDSSGSNISITELAGANKWKTRLFIVLENGNADKGHRMNQAGAISLQAKVYK